MSELPAPAKLKVLLFSSLYPNSRQIRHGIFVETRLRELLRHGEVDAKVVAPVPWFFSAHPRFGRYAVHAAVPRSEIWNGIDVSHPRYLAIPRIGMPLAPFTMALAAAAAVRRLIREGFAIDVIDAHYYYPDGVAAALLSTWLRLPCVITARGTDINLLPNSSIPRLLIRWAGRQASRSIGVSAALARRMAELGIAETKLSVLPNGIDRQRFFPQPRKATRRALGWPDVPTLLSAGNLIELKGHALVIEALARMGGFRLFIIGSGPLDAALRIHAERCGVSDRVTLVPEMPQIELAQYYSAADVLVLASSREGWPNVLLEAIACGTAVVATAVGGIPEIVSDARVGRLARARNAQAIADAVQDLWQDYPSEAELVAHAARFDWATISRKHTELLREASGTK